MPFDPKILKDKLKALKDRIQKADFSDAFVAALNTGNALMQQRIFSENKDVFGNSFGVYIGKEKFISERTTRRLLSGASRTDRVRIRRAAGLALTPYQRKRVNKGKQIIKKDLEFDGELRRSIEVQIINERSAALQFNTDHPALVARGQENQITNIRNGGKGYTQGDGIKIFTFNDNEKELVNEQAKLLINQILNPRQ